MNGFHAHFGLKINLDKSQAISLGKLKRSYTFCNDLNLNCVKQFKLLGVTFSVNLDNIIQLNFGTKILKMEKLFNLYKQFNLSIVGKVTLIKTLPVPKIPCIIVVLPTPDAKIVNRIEQMISDFLWDGKSRFTRSCLEKGNNIGRLKGDKHVKMGKKDNKNNEDWQTIFQSNLTSVNKNSCFELDLKYLQCFLGKITNNFLE